MSRAEPEFSAHPCEKNLVAHIVDLINPIQFKSGRRGGQVFDNDRYECRICGAQSTQSPPNIRHRGWCLSGNKALAKILGSRDYIEAWRDFHTACESGDEDEMRDRGNEVYRVVKRLVEIE